MALEQEYNSTTMASTAEMSIFNVLLCFVLLIRVVFLLFVNLIEHAYEKTAAISIVAAVRRVYICEFFIVSCRKCETD